MKIGTWRLSNYRLTIRVDTNTDGIIIEAAPVAGRFVGKHFDEVCRWMQHIGETDIVLLHTKEQSP